MPSNGYFNIPFGTAGTRTTIPDTVQLDGSVSYEQGYGVDYTLDPDTDPAALDIEEDKFNEALFQITSSLQQLYQTGIPPFITSAMNGGAPYSYGKYAVVLSGGIAYQSLTNANADTPPSAKWTIFSATGIESVLSVAGTNHTAAYTDVQKMVLRSNSGAAMIDTLPGTGTAVLPKGWSSEYVNNDASALLFIGVATGALLNGSATGGILLGPTQRTVIFSDGTNYYAKEMPSRCKLESNANFYINPSTGNDNNSGITSAVPFATMQRAANFLASMVDLGGNNPTVNCAAGAYSDPLTIQTAFTGGGKPFFKGDIATPSNVIINSTTTSCISVTRAAISLAGMKLTSSTTNVNGLIADAGAVIDVNGLMEFGSISTAGSGASHVGAASGAAVNLNSSYLISGGANSHWNTQNSGGRITTAGALTFTLTGTPNFPSAFAQAFDASSQYLASNTFVGSATGKRFNAVGGGVIDVAGAGATYLPGSVTGTQSNGGQYY